MASQEKVALTTDEKFELLIAALSQRSNEGIDKNTLREILNETASASAGAMQKALKPENNEHGGFSALSYPEGDAARPRPVLPFELFWNGYPVHKFPETQHYRELELMAQLRPGTFTVVRKDMSSMKVTVKAERDAEDKITKVRVEFSVSRSEKALVPPMLVMLYQMIHDEGTPKERFIDGMREYLSVL